MNESGTDHACICGEFAVRAPFSDHFDVLQCGRCGTQQFHARLGVPPRQFAYDSVSGKYAQGEYLMGSQLRWSHERLLLREWRGRKVLEMGCFNGFFLNELREHGADVYGFDVNEAALDVGRSLFGLEGRIFGSLDVLRPFAPFDAVVCIDVVEHLDEPQAFLSDMRTLLAPAGTLFLAGPTVERRFFDKSDYPPHHRWRFSRPGLQRCLERVGFSVENMDIQHDGVLMLRNVLGKLLHGFHRKEFYGDTRVEAPAMKGQISRALYGSASAASSWLFERLGIDYCSTVLAAKRH